MINPRVLILTVIFAGIGMAGVGTVLFLPQILKAIGVSNTQAGLLTSVPVCVRHDRDRRLRPSVGQGHRPLLDAGGDLRSGDASAWSWRRCCMTACGCWRRSRVATVGFYGMKSPFWPLPSTFLTGSALAAGLALINSLGNFAGYLGPIAVGYAKDATGTFEAGLYVLAAAAFVSTVTALGCALWMPRGAQGIGNAGAVTRGKTGITWPASCWPAS